MGHLISNTDGVYSFADSRVSADGRTDAWHSLGTPVGHAMTAQEALDAAYLSRWNVRKRPIFVDVREDQTSDADGNDVRGLKVANQFATVFDNPINGKITPLGVVGNKYTCIQNEALADFGNALVDESGSHWETGGSLRDYRQTFLTMKLPRTMTLTGLDGAKDVSEWYLALFNSHDGSSAMFGLVTSVRVVCANTANAAIAGAHSKFSVPHTAGWKANVEIARQKLGITFEYMDAFEAEVQGLFQQPFGNTEMKEFTEELVDLGKAEEGTRAHSIRQNTANGIYKLWTSSSTIKGTPVAGTKAGAFNAVTEFADHFQGESSSKGDINVIRATRTITQAASNSTGLKADAFKLLTKV